MPMPSADVDPLRHPLRPQDGAEQVGVTASGKRPSTAWAAQASFDAEYRRWRSGQLRKLEKTYPQWRQDSYKAFVESCVKSCQSCGPSVRGTMCHGAGAGPQAHA
jgi:hypothetical protein